MTGSAVRRHWKWLTAVVLVGGAWMAARTSGGSAPELPTAEVIRGDYEDIVEVQGEVRPVRSIVLTAPADAGELVILNLARNGSEVKKGDVVAQFDAITLRRTVQERQSELRQAQAELAQATAQANIVDEKQSTDVMRASYDVRRAELALVDSGLVSEVETEGARLALLDAKQRLVEAEQVAKSAREGAAADIRARERRIEKVQADLGRANQSLSSLQMVAPADGTVNILRNSRGATPMSPSQEFRVGERAYPKVPILELPDLTSVHLVARIDEGDRGQLRTGLTATVRADAVPNHEYSATVTDVSVLARIDFMSGWPPLKMFDLKLTFNDADAQLRPGISAVARIPVGQISDVLLVPSDAIFVVDGRPQVYVVRKGQAVPTDIQILRRGRDQTALSGGVTAGDLVTLVQPGTPAAPEGEK